MSETTVQFGAWPSPLTAEKVAESFEAIHRARFTPDSILFSQSVAADRGRTALFRMPRFSPHGEPVRLTPPHLSPVSHNHEYGGGAWAVNDLGDVLLVDSTDQRLYLLRQDTDVFRALSPDTGATVRYGDLESCGSLFVGVSETHDRGTVVRSAVLIDPRTSAIHSVAEVSSGPHFIAWPRLSPTAEHLSYVGWNHPSMPWDTTQVFVQRLTWDESGTPRADGDPTAIYGGEGESVLQPEWLSATRLAVLSDRSGRWQLHSLHVPHFLARSAGHQGTMQPSAQLLVEADGEIGGPLWRLGTKWFLPAHGGTRVLAESRTSTSELLWADITRGEAEEVLRLSCPLDRMEVVDFDGSEALLIGSAADRVTGLYTFDLTTSALDAVILATRSPVHVDHLSRPVVREIAGVPCVMHLPSNPTVSGPTGSAPPFVINVHGGPTSQVMPEISLQFSFFTSRGIGVVDINYVGSTGFGRAYRERLKGDWGERDVDDAVRVAQALVASGEADPRRLAIRGGSAGGYTVLRALTDTGVFACGTSYFGVADCEAFNATTHDFESHYLDGLIGDAAALRAASPVHRITQDTAPAAILQGSADRVVPPEQARLVAKKLQDLGIPHCMAEFPDEGHGFTDPGHVAAALMIELAFYGKIMGFTPPEIPALQLRGRRAS